MQIKKIYVGGWFQRTSLHLSEIYDFLNKEDSPLKLDKRKLNKLRTNLKIKKFELKVDDLEYLDIKSLDGIGVKIFEDGLIVLTKRPTKDLEKDIKELTSYYEKKISPAVSYLFSLGAMLPKELSDIKTIYPYFIVLKNAQSEDIHKILKEFKQEKYFEIKKETFEIYRGNKLYIINNKGEAISDIEKFIQEQIFIREFKGQLHRYLNLHRIIWEKIAKVKERGEIKGSEIDEFYSKIESYAKTINMIESRINQMNAYLDTRGMILKNDQNLEKFIDVLEFKHKNLSNTLFYIKDIWNMTKNYVNSALKLFSDIQAQSTETSVENLTIITSVGVGATLIGLFAMETPEFTMFGILYFLILACLGYLSKFIIKKVKKGRMYEIEDVEVDKKIK